MLRASRLVFLLLLGPAIALPVGCAQSKVEPRDGRKPTAKLVKTEAVRQEALHRTVEVVGTLAAADEVTISSQAEGIVRGVLADLGDRIKAGQTLVEIDREKLQYTLDEQRAAHARALTKYGASESGHLPPVEETADPTPTPRIW